MLASTLLHSSSAFIQHARGGLLISVTGQAFRFLETILARLPLFTIVDKATAHAVWDVKQVLEALHDLACPNFWDESGEYPELLPCAPCRMIERLDSSVFERLDKWNQDCVAVYGRSLVGSWWRSANEGLVAGKGDGSPALA